MSCIIVPLVLCSLELESKTSSGLDQIQEVYLAKKLPHDESLTFVSFKAQN